eukprot:TRINITY_DN11792_c0_g1_i1.p1 TRINITY_DN11792_c0_g1~~TRINITY_DN11792_c0_g1_i1.p1  ORF type:complete len:135 (-),score=18.03 TRINITY_DN11792_c0_g1_i1:9-413(-)
MAFQPQIGDLQTFFDKLLHRVNGLQAISISDRDGVSLLRAQSASYAEIQGEGSLAAVFAIATEQANKLRMGKNKTITSFFEDRVVVHLNHMPLVISFIGDANLNVGALHAFSNDIKIAVEPLKNSILEKERYNS